MGDTAAASLPPFPVDDFTIDQIEHALGGSFTVDEAGVHTLVGSDFTFDQLLNFLSGYDESKLTPSVNEYDTPIPDQFEYPDPIYRPTDVIRALIAEVRRLRGTDG